MPDGVLPWECKISCQHAANGISASVSARMMCMVPARILSEPTQRWAADNTIVRERPAR